MEFEMELPEGFEELELLGTLLSPVKSDMGVVMFGEDFAEGSEEPTILLYLVQLDGHKWRILDELESFTFKNYESAKQFAVDLPSMSAIDLLLLMNRGTAFVLPVSFVQ